MAVPTTPLPLDKSTLRRSLRARRRAFVDAMDAGALDAALVALTDRVATCFGEARVVAGYVAVGAEVDPARLLARAATEGRATALPHVESREATLRFLLWSPGDPLVEGPYGLVQPAADAAPAAPDLILTPLVGFDRRGGRLGQGAGHYDRAFAALPHARRIGLAWSVQEAPHLPLDPWDVALDGIATEAEWIGP